MDAARLGRTHLFSREFLQEAAVGCLAPSTARAPYRLAGDRLAALGLAAWGYCLDREAAQLYKHATARGDDAAAVVLVLYVAEWAGHGVEVLQRVYAHCIDGQDERRFERMDMALGR